MTVNILEKDLEKKCIWIFFNDFQKSGFYKSFMQSCELLNLTQMSISNQLDQNIHCISSDSIEDSLQVAHNFNFKSAIVLLPGTILGGNFTKEITNLKHSCRLISSTDNSLLGFYYNLSPEGLLDKNPDLEVAIRGYKLRSFTPASHNNHPYCPVFQKDESTSQIFSESQTIPFNSKDAITQPMLQSALSGQKIYLYNNESLLTENLSKFENFEIENLIVPASGFYSNDLLSTLKEFNCKKITYYDFHLPSLELKQYVNSRRLNSHAISLLDKENIVCKQKAVQHSSLNDKELENFYQIPKFYLFCDLVSHSSDVLDLLETNKNNWLWISNIYTFNVNIFAHGPAKIFESYWSFISQIKNLAPQTVIHGKDPLGKYLLNYAHEITFDGFGHTPSWKKYYSQDQKY